MKRFFSIPAAIISLVACANEPTTETAIAEDIAAAPEASPAALAIEQAERLLERGGDATEAKRLLEQALSDTDISADERGKAVLALSQAHESLGQSEAAIALIEQHIAEGDDRDRWEARAYRRRLRELLTGSADSSDHEPHRRDPSPAFARFLGKYFPAGQEGRVDVTTFLVGGDDSVTDEVGTYNVGAGLRAALEQRCPLCKYDANVHHSTHRGDWTMIPATRDRFDDALVVFYFDLEHDRVPERYSALLPMDVEEIEAQLAEGKSFVVAKERPGSPPVLLLAAPRAAMLADVERELSGLDALPIEARYVDVAVKLRPQEIQRVVRNVWFADIRSCYEKLLTRVPDAQGKFISDFVIAADGSVKRGDIRTDDRALDDTELRDCLESSLLKLRFPATNGDETTVKYPVVVTPD